jgi:hypothetical protein
MREPSGHHAAPQEPARESRVVITPHPRSRHARAEWSSRRIPGAGTRKESGHHAASHDPARQRRLVVAFDRVTRRNRYSEPARQRRRLCAPLSRARGSVLSESKRATAHGFRIRTSFAVQPRTSGSETGAKQREQGGLTRDAALSAGFVNPGPDVRRHDWTRRDSKMGNGRANGRAHGSRERRALLRPVARSADGARLSAWSCSWSTSMARWAAAGLRRSPTCPACLRTAGPARQRSRTCWPSRWPFLRPT